MNTDKKPPKHISDVDEQPPPPYQETENPQPSSSSFYPQAGYQNTGYPQPQPPPQPQQPQQPRYQTVQLPLPVQARQNNRQFPLAAIFFLFGWFCPPLWILGACCCAGSRDKYEAWWGKVNFMMSILLIVTSLFFSFAMARD
ncbi:hypothetical protein BY458DRAFT_495742 [Sporodiniella umbellata]|nr:hypothetical protein BY458DRAFT_495742 [Sporodiniella umbellata]